MKPGDFAFVTMAGYSTDSIPFAPYGTAGLKYLMHGDFVTVLAIPRNDDTHKCMVLHKYHGIGWMWIDDLRKVN